MPTKVIKVETPEDVSFANEVRNLRKPIGKEAEEGKVTNANRGRGG